MLVLRGDCNKIRFYTTECNNYEAVLALLKTQPLQ